MIEQSQFLLELAQLTENFPITTNTKKLSYYNIPAAFDIETSSYYENDDKKPENKRAIMYHWQFGIWNIVTCGRTWNEFKSLLKKVSVVMDLSEAKRLIVYVHNLPYEFFFMHKHFTWDKVFFLDDKKPVYAITDFGIEFRCSLKLSGGRGLAQVGKELLCYKVEKMAGDLDYELIRTPETQLTEKEKKYCENDIRVITSYIQEKIEHDGDITKIPLTNTGYVRNLCRKACFDENWQRYHRFHTIINTGIFRI